MNLEETFSDENIIDVLCNLRIACARKRHRKHFLYNIANDQRNEPKQIEELDRKYEDIKKLYSLLPPRRLWNHKRPRRCKRKAKVGAELDRIALRATVIERRRSPKSGDYRWLNELNNFINEVQSRVLGDAPYKLRTPKIFPVKKDSNKQDNRYRPIAKYTELDDQVVDKLCAKYFRTIFDSSFQECSYAFRAKSNDSTCPNHHEAVKKLIQFRQNHSEKTFWVAECDIQKFFDCVHHDEARAALNRVAERSGHIIDPRAAEIFEAYLESYSFPRDAITQANEWFQANATNGQLDWCEDLRELWSDPLREPIGIPQGGAISCFIVNLMLDLADRAVIGDSQERDPDLLYLRYCDDIIIVHSDKDKCSNAFERYSEALRLLKLVRHEPKYVESYSKEFWKYKSKHPYKWAYEPNGSSVPWIAFVGYQLRYDGLLRIRPSSLEKELRKQVKETDEILKIVCLVSRNKITSMEVAYSPNARKNKRQIYHRLRQKLISMSVGRIKLEVGIRESPKFCWCAGFKLLREHNYILRSQLKQLDRGRERQLNRVKRRLKDLEVIDTSQQDKSKHYDYYGHPFSYYAQFIEPQSQ